MKPWTKYYLLGKVPKPTAVFNFGLIGRKLQQAFSGVQVWKKDHQIQTLSQSVQSPDQNSVENLWTVIKWPLHPFVLHHQTELSWLECLQILAKSTKNSNVKVVETIKSHQILISELFLCKTIVLYHLKRNIILCSLHYLKTCYIFLTTFHVLHITVLNYNISILNLKEMLSVSYSLHITEYTCALNQ